MLRLSGVSTVPLQILSHHEVIARLRRGVEAVRELCEPEFVVLFGSYAYGEPHTGSDVDVLLVLPDEVEEEVARGAGTSLHRHFGSGLEVHRCTLSQWREALRKRNWFVAQITRRGISLFSRRPWSAVLKEVERLMNQSENLYPLEWIGWAEDDWWAGQTALDAGRVYVAAYHLQQAVEKWLKAFLLHQGGALERTQELEELLNEAVQYEPGLERFRTMCHRVKYFIAARYPGLPQPPAEEELGQPWLPQAEALRAFVRRELGPEAS